MLSSKIKCPDCRELVYNLPAHRIRSKIDETVECKAKPEEKYIDFDKNSFVDPKSLTKEDMCVNSFGWLIDDYDPENKLNLGKIKLYLKGNSL